MCRSTNHAIDVRFLNIKINIKSVKNVKVCTFAEKIINHLNIRTTFLLILSCIAAYLNPSRIKWSILILKGTDQNYMLEPFKTTSLTKFIQSCLLNILVVSHLQLIQHNRLLPHFEERHASGK